jgi:hypothetical protein
MDFKITEKELEQLEHFKDVVENTANLILSLSNSTKSNVTYGFELGRIYSELLQLSVRIYELETQIRDNGGNR